MNVSYKDFFYKLRNKKVGRLYHQGGIVILNTDELAATIDSNVMRNQQPGEYTLKNKRIVHA